MPLILNGIKSLKSGKNPFHRTLNFKPYLATIAARIDFVSEWFYAPRARLHPATSTYRAEILPLGIS
jgi:hypothetical protein